MLTLYTFQGFTYIMLGLTTLEVHADKDKALKRLEEMQKGIIS